MYHVAHAMIVSTGLRRSPELLLTFLVATVAALHRLREAILGIRGVTILANDLDLITNHFLSVGAIAPPQAGQ